MKEAGESSGRPDILWDNAIFFAVWTLATLVAVPWYAITIGVSWVDLAACVALWFVMGVSITAGYHRLFAHRSYQAGAPVRLVFALFGAAAWQASIITWAAHHRFHHRHVDTNDDPYDATRGFWYSHIGWLLVRGAKHGDLSNVPDLWKDPTCRWQHRHWITIAVVVNLALTFGLGLLTGRMLGMVVFALLLRVLILHHATWLINSAAHSWGSQPYGRGHSARDNWFLSLLTYGEGYHNYHHTFQADYRNGPKWFNFDPTKWLIWLLAKLGVAGRLRRMPADVTLSARFEKTLADFEERLAGVDAQIRGALRERIEAAQARCEEALTELEAARKRLLAAAPGEVRRLRRRLRNTRRAAKRAVASWQEAAHSALLELAPAS